MENLPATSELILTIFTSLLSFVVSLLLIKIQSSNNKTISKIINEQKILLAKKSEIDAFASSKITTENETESAREFLEKDARVNLNEIREKLVLLSKQLPALSLLAFVGMLFMFFAFGLTVYLIYIIVKNGGVIYISTLVSVMTIDAAALVFICIETYYVRKYSEKYEALRKRKDYVISEIEKAVRLVNKVKSK